MILGGISINVVNFKIHFLFNRVKLIILVCVFITFSSCKLFVNVPRISPYDLGEKVGERILFCNFNDNIKNRICLPLILFEDGTVFKSTRLIHLDDINKLVERDKFYDEFGESGWGKYTILGDTLKYTYAEYFNYGGSLKYHRIEHIAFISADTIKLQPNYKLSTRWRQERVFEKIENVDLSFIDPTKAWINQK